MAAAPKDASPMPERLLWVQHLQLRCLENHSSPSAKRSCTVRTLKNIPNLQQLLACLPRGNRLTSKASKLKFKLKFKSQRRHPLNKKTRHSLLPQTIEFVLIFPLCASPALETFVSLCNLHNLRWNRLSLLCSSDHN